jgi:hypothetical protein
METKLTQQSEAILEKLKEDVRRHTLTDDELVMVRKGLAAYEGLGVLGNVVIKASGFIAAGAILWNFLLPWWKKS